MRAAGADRREGRLGGSDARQHGVVRALDARHVHESGRAADQHAARKHKLGDRLPAAFGDGPGAVGDALAALEGVANGRMRLEALELAVRRQMRVGVIEVHDEADRHQVVAIVIEERAAAGTVVERPAERVLHQPWAVLAGLHLPDLLEAQAVLLRLAALRQAEPRRQLLGQRAPRTLGDDGVLAAQLHAAREAIGRLAVLAYAHVAGGDAQHGALVVVEHLGRGEARIDLHAQLGSLLAQPAREVAEAADVVAMIAHQRRHDDVGDAQDASRTEVVEAVLGDRRLERGALGLPIGKQRGQSDRIDDGARQDVRADLRALLEHDDRHLVAGRGRQLLQADGCGQAGRTRADNDDVELHCFARRQLRVVLCHQTILECHQLASSGRSIGRLCAQRQASCGRWRIRHAGTTGNVRPGR